MWEFITQKILKISSLSTFDYITVQASFYYLIDKRFGCEDKIREYAKKTTIEKARRLISEANGCNKISEKHKYEIDNIRFHTCFCKFKHPQMGFFLHLFNQYEKGLLPFEGCLVDQPNYIIEIFSLISKLKSEREEEEQKRQNVDNGKRNNRYRSGNQGV